MNSNAEGFLGEAGVALLQESHEDWILSLAFEGVTGFYYSSTLFTMWRAYLLRDELGAKFDELVNVMVLWSAIRCAPYRGPTHSPDGKAYPNYVQTLFNRYKTGRLRGDFIGLQRAEVLGRRIGERVSRRLEPAHVRRARLEYQDARRAQTADRELHRNPPNIDLEVIQKGFGFVVPMIRNAGVPGKDAKLPAYLRELFDLEMRSLPRPTGDDPHCEIKATPYEYDRWILQRVAEYVATSNSIEVARSFYRPIIDLGAPGRYWVEDFLEAWIIRGAQLSADLAGFANIWRDMTEYAMARPIWQPDARMSWSRTESLAADLMGLGKQAGPVLGQAKYRSLVSAMAPVFEQWANVWMKYASVAAWFAHFLPTDAGQSLLPFGIQQLAGVVSSFRQDDWHRYSLGVLFSEAIGACWKHLSSDVESNPDLRSAFLKLLTDLTARQVPEAIHLRSKVSERMATS